MRNPAAECSLHRDYGVRLRPRPLDFNAHRLITGGQIRDDHVELVQAGADKSTPMRHGRNASDAHRKAVSERHRIGDDPPGGLR